MARRVLKDPLADGTPLLLLRPFHRQGAPSQLRDPCLSGQPCYLLTLGWGGVRGILITRPLGRTSLCSRRGDSGAQEWAKPDLGDETLVCCLALSLGCRGRGD